MSAANLIEVPVPCTKCGYDLRATPIGGTCPECGQRVVASIKTVRVEGAYLVVRDGAILPNRCIKTNEPIADLPVTKKLYWASSWIYLLLFANVLVMVVVYLAVRKKCAVTYYISSPARSAHRIRVGVLLALFFVTVPIIIIGFANDQAAVGIAGLLVNLGSLIALCIFSNLLSVSKYVDGEFWIKGCGKEFLDSIEAGM